MTLLWSLVKKAWPYLVIVLLLCLGAFLVYKAGYNKAWTAGELRMSQVLQAEAEEKVRMAAILRGQELAHRSEISKLEQEGVNNAEEIRKNLETTIADLNSGTLRLRKRLAALESRGPMPGSGPVTGVDRSGSAETSGLRSADAVFLVRTADGADQRANALKTCVTIAHKDRAMLMEWYNKKGTTTR